MVKTPASQQPAYQVLRDALNAFALMRRPAGDVVQAAAAVTAALRDFSAIDRAIVQHRLTVQFASGNERTYETVDQMRAEQQTIAAEVQSQIALIRARAKAAAPRRRIIPSPFMN